MTVANLTWKDYYLRFHRNMRLPGFFTLMRLWNKKHIRCRSRYGATLDLSPWEYIDNTIIEEGYYESEVIEMLSSHLRDDGVLWDVGANIGLHSITAACLRPSAHVVAFEPNPNVFQCMENNIRLNGVEVQAFPFALGEQNSSATLHVGLGGNSGMASLFNRYEGPKVEVEVRTARSLLDEGKAPSPTALKLDVEGGEWAALRGFGDLRKLPGLKLIVFESDLKLLENPEADPVARLLMQAGFELTRLVRREKTHHALANFAAVRPML